MIVEMGVREKHQKVIEAIHEDFRRIYADEGSLLPTVFILSCNGRWDVVEGEDVNDSNMETFMDEIREFSAERSAIGGVLSFSCWAPVGKPSKKRDGEWRKHGFASKCSKQELLFIREEYLDGCYLTIYGVDRNGNRPKLKLLEKARPVDRCRGMFSNFINKPTADELLRDAGLQG